MFKNKIFKAIISTAMAFMLAASPVCGHAGNIKVMAVEADANGFVIEDGVLKKYEGNEAVVTVPNTVTSIGSGAFSNCTGITSIVVPGTVTSIGERAFYGCSGLQSIELSEGIKSLGKWAFYGCSALESVVLPDGMESIGELAFYNCTNLGSITIPASVINIGNSALSVNSTESLVIYGQIGSFAESYANKNKIEFIEVGSDQEENQGEDAPDIEGKVVTQKSVIKSLEQVSLTSAKVAYQKYKDAKGYQIVYATDKNFTKNKKTKYTTGLSYTITGLTNKQKYYVKVRAYKLNSKKAKVFLGKFSSVKSVYISSNFENKITSLKRVDMDRIKVSYCKFNTAAGYRITYATNATLKENKKVVYTNNTSYTLKDLINGNIYYVQVRAYKLNSKKQKVYLGNNSNIESIQLSYDFKSLQFNSEKYSFLNYGHTRKVIGEYYNDLMKNVNNNNADKSYIHSQMNENGGNCYGMSCVLALSKAGRIDPAFFKEKNEKHLGDFVFLDSYGNPGVPKEGTTLYNLISYYQLMQFMDNRKAMKGEGIVNAIKSSSYPVVIVIYGYDAFQNDYYGHAVVAQRIVTKNDGYYIDIWDPNEEALVSNQLYISKDFKTHRFLEGDYDTGKNYTYFGYALTVESSNQTFDQINLQVDFSSKWLTGKSALKKTKLVKAQRKMGKFNGLKVTDGSDVATSSAVHLITTCTDFTITSSNGDYAKVNGMQVLEGNLNIQFSRMENGIGEQSRFRFEVPSLKKEENYTITPNTENSPCDIVLWNQNDQDGFYCSLKAEKAVTLTVDSEGTMKTSTNNGEAIYQKIEVAKNGLNWTTTKVDGTDSGFIAGEEDGKIQISSNNNVQVNLNIVKDQKDLSIENIKAEDGKIVVADNQEEYVVSDSQGNELARKNMGYIVRFFTLNDTTVEDVKNVSKGSKIEEPKLQSYEGYEFAGWYLSQDYKESEKWNFANDEVNDDTMLFAKWIKKDTEGDKKNQKNQKITIAKPTKLTLKNTAKKAIKVTWKKVSGAKGYNVAYSANKKFAKSKTKTITVKGNKASTVIKKLKKGKTYYVKVRAYKKDGTKTVYGKYSVVKKVRIKK